LPQKAVTFNAETFEEFLYHLLRHTKKKIYLVLNNTRWHRAKKLKPLFAKGRIVPIYLPPYSPELNPIERV